MKITAGIVTAPFEAHIGEVEAGEPGPRDVVIRTEYSFISNGTESHVHIGTFPESPKPFPRVTGYQAAGIIERVGKDVQSISVGDRVFTRGNRVVGVIQTLGGTHAGTIVSAEEEVIALPSAVDPAEAAALVVAQVGFNGAQRLPEKDMDRILVVGDGVIGQFAAQALIIRGFQVIMAGHHGSRLELARGVKPSLKTVNTAEAGWEERLDSLCGGEVDAAVDSVGTEATLDLCQSKVRKFGHVVVLGWQGGNQSLKVHAGFSREMTVHFPAGMTVERLTATLKLIEKEEIRVNPLVTHRFKYQEFPEACRLLRSANRDFLGILIDWS